MAAGSIVFLLGWAWHADQQIQILDEQQFFPGLELDASKLKPAAFQARTDGGRQINLWTLPPNIASAEDMQEMEINTVRQGDLAEKQIRTGPPSEDYNCHGWVFAAGSFWVRGCDVPAILEDNGYLLVCEPEVGDIIVYHDKSDTVTHSGVVRAVTEEGTVLVESKWGWLGRFLHMPQDTFYGDHWAYYHTDRPGHRLAGVSPGSTPPILTAE